MRIEPTLWCIPSLALAACSQAGATPVDSADDFHCGVTAEYYFELAKEFDRPKDEQRATYVLSQWYYASWQIAHPEGLPNRKAAVMVVAKSIEADQKAHLGVLKECMERAVNDPKFSRFADMLP